MEINIPIPTTWTSLLKRLTTVETRIKFYLLGIKTSLQYEVMRYDQHLRSYGLTIRLLLPPLKDGVFFCLSAGLLKQF